MPMAPRGAGTLFHVALTNYQYEPLFTAFRRAVDRDGNFYPAYEKRPSVRAYLNDRCYVGIEIGDVTIWTDGGMAGPGPFVVHAEGRDVPPPPASVRAEIDRARVSLDFDKPGPVARDPLQEAWPPELGIFERIRRLLSARVRVRVRFLNVSVHGAVPAVDIDGSRVPETDGPRSVTGR